MKFLLLACTAFLIFTTNLLSQNLVPNPSFEELTSCPVDLSVDSTGIAKAKHWFTTDKHNTPDLFNECTPKGAHYAFFGPQNTPAKTGKGYAGIECFSERMEVRLKGPLVKNKTYRVQMYVNEPDTGERTHALYSSSFYFCFSKIMIIKKYIEESLLSKKVISIIKNDSNMSNRTKWKLFSAYYTAKGGEVYFAFGGLNSAKAIDERNNEEYNHTIPYDAYYYIDDVSVEEDSTAPASAPVAFQGKLVSGQKLTLKNIFFETAKANLLSTSNKELDALAKSLQDNLLISLNIFGYTDSTGNEMSNIELSTKRAEAVRNYLVGKGIALKRINCKGCGSANPVASNKMELGKQNNRRVEIEVTGTN
jgi:OOP family OmpA-OmpF porin